MNSLQNLGIKYDSDRSKNLVGNKTYHQYYQEIFQNHKIETILELGVYYGNGLCCLRDYFPNANLIGIDLSLNSYNKNLSNVNLYESSQTDSYKLNEILSKNPRLDLVIDDASHEVEKSIQSFNIIFPYLNSNGIYIIEDLQCFNTKYNKGIKPNFRYDNGINVSYFESDFDNLTRFINELSINTVLGRYEEVRITTNTLIIIKK